MRHALPRECSHTLRHNHCKSFDQAPLPLRQAARVKPKKPAGQRSVNGRLGFLVIHSHHGQSALSLTQPAAQVRRTERVFEIDAGGKPHDRPSRKISLQRPAQARLVSTACRTSRSRRPLIPIAAKIKTRRTILPHALNLQPQRGGLHFRIQHPPHEISLARPKMQQALVVLTGDREFRIRQIEGNGAIFHHNGGARAKKEIRQHLAEGIRSHALALSARPKQVSVTPAPDICSVSPATGIT